MHDVIEATHIIYINYTYVQLLFTKLRGQTNAFSTKETEFLEGNIISSLSHDGLIERLSEELCESNSTAGILPYNQTNFGIFFMSRLGLMYGAVSKDFQFTFQMISSVKFFLVNFRVSLN